MEVLNKLITCIFSWQGVAIILAILLRKPLTKIIERFVSSGTGKAKIGPIEIELGKLAEDGQIAIDKMNEINLVMAQSRTQELEITLSTFGHAFTEAQRKQMLGHISKLKELASKI